MKFQVLGTNGLPIPASLAATFVCAGATDRPATVTFGGAAPVCAVYSATQNFFQTNIRTSSTLALDAYPLKVEIREGGSVVASRQVTVTVTK